MSRLVAVDSHHLSRASSRLVALAFAVSVAAAVLLGPTPARAQTGGATGTTGTTALAGTDIFLGIQKGVTSSSGAVLNANAVAKAVTVPSTYRVTMFLGNMCDNSTFTGSCLQLGDISASDFRLNGMLVQTSVDALAHSYGADLTVAGSGGVSGGSGGTTGTTTRTGICGDVPDGFTQTLWLFIGANPGQHETVSTSLALAVDVVPPPAPTNVVVQPADQALLVNWTAVDKTIRCSAPAPTSIRSSRRARTPPRSTPAARVRPTTPRPPSPTATSTTSARISCRSRRPATD